MERWRALGITATRDDMFRMYLDAMEAATGRDPGDPHRLLLLQRRGACRDRRAGGSVTLQRPCRPLDVVPEHVGSSGPPWRLSAVGQLNSQGGTRMDLHGNAALSWSGRRELARRVVEQGWTLTAAAGAAGVSVPCARKWVGRYRAGDRRLLDRSSAPKRVANRTEQQR